MNGKTLKRGAEKLDETKEGNHLKINQKTRQHKVEL